MLGSVQPGLAEEQHPGQAGEVERLAPNLFHQPHEGTRDLVPVDALQAIELSRRNPSVSNFSRVLERKNRSGIAPGKCCANADWNVMEASCRAQDDGAIIRDGLEFGKRMLRRRVAPNPEMSLGNQARRARGSEHNPALVFHHILLFHFNRMREGAADRVSPPEEAAPFGEGDDLHDGGVAGQFDERLDVR
jgi:hypothetical protein